MNDLQTPASGLIGEAATAPSPAEETTAKRKAQLQVAKDIIHKNPTTTVEIVAAVKALVKVLELSK